MRNTVLTLLSASLWSFPTATWACSVCFGDASSNEVAGIRGAIFFLLGLITCVLIGFAFFFFYLRRQAKRWEQQQHRQQNDQIRTTGT